MKTFITIVLTVGAVFLLTKIAKKTFDEILVIPRLEDLAAKHNGLSLADSTSTTREVAL